jgi:hypothetical protein
MTTTPNARKFGPKELVKTRDGWTGRVSASYKEDGVVQYMLSEINTGESKTVAEKDLQRVALG